MHLTLILRQARMSTTVTMVTYLYFISRFLLTIFLYVGRGSSIVCVYVPCTFI